MQLIIYLKFGADATLSAKQAMLVTPYDSRKNILTSTATLFKFPIKRTIYILSKRKTVRCLHYHKIIVVTELMDIIT